MRRQAVVVSCMLLLIPTLITLFSIFGPFLTDTIYLYSALGRQLGGAVLPGFPTIDPNFGTSSYGEGTRAAWDVVSGRLPLWNPYAGFGVPLLAEMQPAALFPPTWLLVLPHGQAIEQALLQFIGGLGSYLFFRRFGLSTRASLAGGMLFEVNGVFAWLRNAIYNPVAFLPWLFLAVESVYLDASSNRPLARRLPSVSVGAIAGALAIYSGFPEEAYLYGLLLLVWTVFRAICLSPRQNVAFFAALVLTAVTGLALSAPVLLAFLQYLSDAVAGAHAGNGFYGTFLGVDAALQYITPYIHGPIFATPIPAVRATWGSIGGYIGFAPLVVAIASLLTPGYRGTKIVLAGWIVIAVSVSQGVPGIYQVFMLLPLTKIAATYRYLNISWIFCIIFLATIFIHQLPTLTPNCARRSLVWAVSASLFVVAVLVGAVWPLLRESLGAINHPSTFAVGSFVVVLVLSVGLLLAAILGPSRRTSTGIAAVILAEAVCWFMVPYLSYPRLGHIDVGLISFLRANLGYARIKSSPGHGITPSYGSALGIAELDYENIPGPALAAEYIKNHLDPYANPNSYLYYFPFLPPEQEADRWRIFQERLPAFANVGVKYLLAGGDFGGASVFQLSETARYPYALSTGQRIQINARGSDSMPTPVNTVSALIGTYGGESDGSLEVSLCSQSVCGRGIAALASAEDNQSLSIRLDHPVPIATGRDYSVSIEKVGGRNNVALWLFPRAKNENATSIAGTPGDTQGSYLPILRFATDKLKRVYEGSWTDVYELPGVRNYFSADSCTLQPISREVVDASCARTSKLVRLELFMRGWTATVNGQPAPIELQEGAFQSVELPVGKARIAFSYAPPGFGWALAAAAAALVCVLALFAAPAMVSLTFRGRRLVPRPET